ncbi:hypothetical protein ACERII_10410 [Evansella sp. AB-rgal1]|uniref:hypothetical protein n=1 Tax=Evansella sp. AB-rgal1 TaxID=3242696 RepID=UPI00359ED870
MVILHSFFSVRKVRNTSIVTLLATLFIISMIVPPVNVLANEEEVIDIHEYVSNMQPGWNLGNTFDAVGEDETAWGNPRVTKELIEQIADQGFKIESQLRSINVWKKDQIILFTKIFLKE